MNKKVKKITGIILLIITVFLFYNYVVERCMALYAYQRYSTRQGVDPSAEAEKRVFKDWKNGGYAIFVRYSDNPEYEYQYAYKLQMDGKYPKYQMSLWIFDTETREILDPPYGESVKYKPLD